MLITCGELGLDPNTLSLADYAGAIFQHNLRNSDGENKPQMSDEDDEYYAELDRLIDKEAF